MGIDRWIGELNNSIVQLDWVTLFAAITVRSGTCYLKYTGEEKRMKLIP